MKDNFDLRKYLAEGRLLKEEMKTLDAETMKISGTEPLDPSKLKSGMVIAKNKHYKDKAELEAYAGKFTTIDVDGVVSWTEKDGSKGGWNDINDLVLVKNLTW